MRKLVSQSLLITAILVGACLFFAPHHAEAAAVDTALSLLTGGTDLFYGLIGKIFWWVLIPLGGLVLQLLGLVIDSAVSLSLDPSFYNSEAIGIAWSIVRDLANMLFIFVLIYEGIKTILNIGNLASVKRTIASVIIAALLLNFSLFFTKAMIDVSNVATAWFVQGITNLGGSNNISMSKAVHSTLQMEKLTRTSGGTLASAAEAKSFSLQSFTQGVLLFALICVAIYVFFQMTFLIVGRIIAFIFLLITAPIGFTGVFLSLGDLSKQASEWWDEMLKQLMMLPMFFLMLYLTLFMVDRFDNLVFGSETAASDFTPGNYLIFFIIIGMLLKALQVAKDNSSAMGKTIAGVAKGAMSFAGGAVAMGTIGKAARVIGNSAGVQQWAAGNSSSAFGRLTGAAVGRMTLQGVKGVAGSGFGVKSGLKEAGIDKMPLVGDSFKGADKGYEGKIAQEKKDTETFMKNLGKGAAGASNRMAYAQGQKNSLYNRVVSSRKTSSGVGAVAGGAIGSAFGPVGTALGAAAGAATGAVFKQPLTGAMRDHEFKEGGEEAYKKAEKEYKKEAGGAVKEVIDEVNKDAELKKLNEEMKKIEEDIKKSDESYAKATEAEKAKADAQRAVAAQRLSGFNPGKNEINGLTVDKQTFDAEYAKAQREANVQPGVVINMKTVLEAQKAAKKKAIEERAKKVLAEKSPKDQKSHLDRLKDKGVKAQTWAEINEAKDAGQKAKEEEDAEKLKKGLEKMMADEAPKEEAKKDEPKGGDKK